MIEPRGEPLQPGGHPRMVFSFTTADGMVTSIELISDAARLGAMDLVIADA